jgi:hypothetical protein
MADKNSQGTLSKTATSEAVSAPPAPGASSGVPVTYTVRVIDVVGTVYYTAKKTGNGFTIPVSNLKSGNYVLEISDGKTVSSKPLVISH